MVILQRMQQRRYTAAQWTSSNDVLLQGELGIELDTGKWKVGDGTTAWTSVAYQPSNAGISAAISAAITNLVNGSPGALDTLNELAAALGNDANFASTVTNALAAKAPLASPTFTGTPAVPTAAPGTNTTQAASTAFVAAATSNVSVTDASPTGKGIVQLAGDLAGTATSPTVPGLAGRLALTGGTLTGDVISKDGSKLLSITDGNSRYQPAYGSVEVLLSATNNGTAASANVAALNTAISNASTAGGGTVTVSLPGTYYLNDHILIRSNVTLRSATGVVYKKIATATNNVCLLRNANLSTTRGYTDQNIVIDGGIWDGNYSNNSGALAAADTTTATINTLQYGMQGELAFIGVSGLTVKNLTVQNANGFAVQLLADNFTVADVTLNTARDGIHVNGPSRGGRIRNVYGNTDDDFIALNAWDWHRSGPAVGLIEEIAVEDCTYLGTSGIRGTYGRAIKFLPGTRSTGAGTGTGNIRNIRVANLSILDSNGVAIMSDFDQVNGTEYSGAGTVENVTFDTCYWRTIAADNPLSIYKDTTGGTAADGQTSLTIRNVVLRNVQFDLAANSASNGVAISYLNTGLAINGLVFRDCSWTPKSGGASQFLNIQSKSVIDTIEVDGLAYLSASGTFQAPVAVVNTYGTNLASEVKYLTVNRVTTAPGVALDTPVIVLNGIVDYLAARDWAMTFTGGSSDTHGIYFSNSVAQLVDATLSGLRLTNPKELFNVRAGATGSVICKATVRDSIITGSTHPIFVQGGRQADIRFRGGSIDTPNNIARVDGTTAGTALTLTLDGTTTSGTGATTITLVSTPTVRVRKADQVSLNLSTLALTPGDGDQVYSSATPTTVVSGTGAGLYIYRAATGWVKLN